MRSEARIAASGRVSLVGAGPGDPELLTVKALRVLEAADVVLFDDLVSADIVDLAPPAARRIAVGKRGYRGGCSQARIHALLISHARRGRHVVRLKSGDPLIFGRAGEEIAVLRAAGIEVEVVPGITAALALGARVGCSLTHRDHAQALRLVTGRVREGGLPAGFAAAGADNETLVVYMGARQVAALAAELLQHGRLPATPALAAVALGGTREVVWCGNLANLVAGVATLDPAGPIVIGVGEVFRAARPGSVMPAPGTRAA